MTTGHKPTKSSKRNFSGPTGYTMETFLRGVSRLSAVLCGTGGGPTTVDCSANEFKNANPFVAPAMKRAVNNLDLKPYNFIYRRNHESLDSFVFRYETAKAKYEAANTEENDMAMSRDRVRFFVPVQRLSVGFQEGVNPYRKVLCDTLGFSMAELKCYIEQCRNQCQDHIEFICRPSQFGRFTIARNDAGICNAFKEIRPEIFMPERSSPREVIVDCAENPARHC